MKSVIKMLAAVIMSAGVSGAADFQITDTFKDLRIPAVKSVPSVFAVWAQARKQVKTPAGYDVIYTCAGKNLPEVKSVVHFISDASGFLSRADGTEVYVNGERLAPVTTSQGGLLVTSGMSGPQGKIEFRDYSYEGKIAGIAVKTEYIGKELMITSSAGVTILSGELKKVSLSGSSAKANVIAAAYMMAMEISHLQ